jgi:hypothetical protein
MGGMSPQCTWRRRVRKYIAVIAVDTASWIVGTEIRYVSAWFDDELTKLEGAE